MTTRIEHVLESLTEMEKDARFLLQRLRDMNERPATFYAPPHLHPLRSHPSAPLQQLRHDLVAYQNLFFDGVTYDITKDGLPASEANAFKDVLRLWPPELERLRRTLLLWDLPRARVREMIRRGNSQVHDELVAMEAARELAERASEHAA